MQPMLPEALTFDDVLLVPAYSEITSRSEVSIISKVGLMPLDVPVLSANMDTITGVTMAKAMWEAGGCGVLHRYQPFPQTYQDLVFLRDNHTSASAIPSVGIQDVDKRAAELYRGVSEHICVDVAHGDHKNVVEMIRFLKRLDYYTIIAGNVATRQGAVRLVQAGANVIKVGVGPGSVCTTRLVTGHGYPQLSAIMEVAAWREDYGEKFHIIADGGMKTSGDMVKALAAGADAVMSGYAFSGCPECPNGGTHYRGMASEEAQMEFRGEVSNGAAEGVSVKLTPGPKTAGQIVSEIAGGIRSGLSYSGCTTLKEFHKEAQFVRVSANTVHENGVRW